MTDDANVVRFEPGIPGHHHIEGTDLEVVFNRHGDNLVLRVNKGPVQVFRALLVDACKTIPEAQLMRFNPVSPDVVFKIGDMAEGVQRMLAAARPESAPAAVRPLDRAP
jgi:hypothetical protein